MKSWRSWKILNFLAFSVCLIATDASSFLWTISFTLASFAVSYYCSWYNIAQNSSWTAPETLIDQPDGARPEELLKPESTTFHRTGSRSVWQRCSMRLAKLSINAQLWQRLSSFFPPVEAPHFTPRDAHCWQWASKIQNQNSDQSKSLFNTCYWWNRMCSMCEIWYEVYISGQIFTVYIFCLYSRGLEMIINDKSMSHFKA